MKPIYAFYSAVLNSNQDEQFARANYWKHSWQKAGWAPAMLNKSHAAASQYSTKLARRIHEFATQENMHPGPVRDQFSATLLRWCALHASKGGWMSHYDVINAGFTPEQAGRLELESQLHITQDKAYLFYASQKCITQALDKFLSEPWLDGSRMKGEAEILGLGSTLEELNLPIIHVQANGEKKSEKMKSICQELE